MRPTLALPTHAGPPMGSPVSSTATHSAQTKATVRSVALLPVLMVLRGPDLCQVDSCPLPMGFSAALCSLRIQTGVFDPRPEADSAGP